jgi:peptidoglycan/xylan/chitin deacetylase (PgdA/CDA1 family)
LLLLPSAIRGQDVAADGGAMKEIAVTIDDLPLNGPNIGIKRLHPMTAKVLSALTRAQAPAVGFVNESLLYVPGETDERIALLREWTQAGVELGNHTFSHLRFSDVSLTAYEDDFVRGDAVTAKVMSEKGTRPRFFRHPYLKMGATRELETSFEAFIAERGYRIAPVTVDSMDWMFLAAYLQSRDGLGAAKGKLVSDEYRKYVAAKVDFCAAASQRVFGRPVVQILLLHANELNADNLADLLSALSAQGYRFVTLERALQDPAYVLPDQYADTSDWLSLWAKSKQLKLEAPVPPEFIRQAYANQGR